MQIPAGRFKAECLQLMDQVRDTREELVITKRGKPVAKLVPVDDSPQPLFGMMAGSVQIHGDIVEPVGEVWEADE